jgi:hypothetical protein
MHKIIIVCLASVGLLAAVALADEPPAVNPFGPKDAAQQQAVAGCIELSDGTRREGMIRLTRDKRLVIYDEELKRQREVPLSAVKLIECRVEREWQEKEWRFKESASDEKVYTGRSYPVREYVHTLTLRDGRRISGPLSALVYLDPPAADGAQPPAERFILHKRDKGAAGQDPKTWLYVRRIELRHGGDVTE